MQEIDTDYVVVGCGASAMAASLSRVASMKPISAVLQESSAWSRVAVTEMVDALRDEGHQPLR